MLGSAVPREGGGRKRRSGDGTARSAQPRRLCSCLLGPGATLFRVGQSRGTVGTQGPVRPPPLGREQRPGTGLPPSSFLQSPCLRASEADGVRAQADPGRHFADRETEARRREGYGAFSTSSPRWVGVVLESPGTEENCFPFQPVLGGVGGAAPDFIHEANLLASGDWWQSDGRDTGLRGARVADASSPCP